MPLTTVRLSDQDPPDRVLTQLRQDKRVHMLCLSTDRRIMPLSRALAILTKRICESSNAQNEIVG
jgi:hypothetical protein